MPRHSVRGLRIVFAAAALLATALPAALLAQTTTDPAVPAAPATTTPAETAPTTSQPATPGGQAALEELEASLAVSREKAEALKAEIAELEGDRARQNAALIAAGQRVKLAEIEVADVEQRLDDLIVKEFEVRGRLDGADTDLANMLAALERVSRNPPPALLVDPSDALGSARSGILMSAIFPQLTARAQQVRADLNSLTEIKQAALEEEKLLRANYAVLGEEQLRIATLLEARKQNVAAKTAELEAEEQAASELASRATSLKELIESLSKRVDSVSRAAAAAKASPEGVPADLNAETVKLAFADTARSEPALPFGAIKGYLTPPALGESAVGYGASDGFGGISHGISLLTRADAQVLAPADGWVLYKGPYLNYGQIIILNTGQDYTLLLAGLRSVDVEIGQFVLMGEPVGAMGSRTIGQTVTTNAGNARPTLYIEMRKNNEPVDPTGWWVNPDQMTQTG